MGTTSQYVNFGRKDTGEIKKFFAELYNGESERYVWEVVYQSLRSNAIYEAVKRTNKFTGESEVLASVTKYGFEGGEFYYKHMDETMCPYFYDAPMKLIKMLTPTENILAMKWRGEVISRHTNKKVSSKPKVGDTIKFKSSIDFTNGTVDDTFTYCERMKSNGRKEKYFKSKRLGFTCKIRKWQEKEYEIVKEKLGVN